MEASKPSKGPFLADYDPDPSVRTEKFDKRARRQPLLPLVFHRLIAIGQKRY